MKTPEYTVFCQLNITIQLLGGKEIQKTKSIKNNSWFTILIILISSK